MSKTPAASFRRRQILGYTDKLTVRPGESVEFKVSVEGGGAYAAQLVRLINGDIYSKAAPFKEIEIDSPVNGRYEGRQQLVTPGSCVVVENTGPLNLLREFTVVVNVMPTMFGHDTQHMIGSWDRRTRAGWSLHINEHGQLAFTAVDDHGRSASVVVERSLKEQTWYTAVLRVSWIAKTVRLDCRTIGTHWHGADNFDEQAVFEALGEYPSVSSPLLMAAAWGGRTASERVIPVDCFNGRLEAPVIYQGLLSETELSPVVAGERPSPLNARLVADWDFSDGITGTQIKDRSVNELHGYTYNLPLRGVKGRHWNGTTMEWRHAPEQYAAIHFHSDDLYDCGWLTDIKYLTPGNMRSGVYALRLRRDEDSGSNSGEEYLPFFVAAPRGAPQSKIAFIAPTYTYMAYGNFRFVQVARKKSGAPTRKASSECLGFFGPGAMEYILSAQLYREFAGSLYDRHVDGSPVHFSSWMRPLLNFRPKSILWTFSADLLLIDWLVAQGFEYDVITDDLLQEEGADLLKDYRVVITGNHPEYVTAEQLSAIESYLAQGGRWMYMGGNGYYWRVEARDALIEVRRGRAGTGTWKSEVGESAHALSGEMGGLWREQGRPPQKLFGVGFMGMGQNGSYYRVVPEARRSCAAFILEGVEEDVIGDFGIFDGGAAGQEIDKTNAAYGTPDHAVVVARSENHGPKMLPAIEEITDTSLVEQCRSLTCAEVTYFETPNGGAVFSVGSISWCGSLSHNNYHNNVSTITANVLKRFSQT